MCNFTPRIIIVSGPSGVGKTSICEAICNDKNNLYRSISATTRVKRVGEVDGQDYFFLTLEDFLSKVNNGEFLEHANVHGNYYGTLKKNIEIARSRKQDCLVEIDVQGAEQIQKHDYYEIISIFIGLSSEEALRERLIARGSETKESITKRMKNMLDEYKQKDKYTHYVENICLETSIQMVENIILNGK